jgi:serine/threonine protein kinase
MRSNDDNLVLEEQQQRLAAWTGLEPQELALVLKNCKSASDLERAAACDLLERCLQSKPEQRPTMQSVLEFAFLNGRAADMKLLLDKQAELGEDIHQVENKVGALGDALEEAKVVFIFR